MPKTSEGEMLGEAAKHIMGLLITPLRDHYERGYEITDLEKMPIYLREAISWLAVLWENDTDSVAYVLANSFYVQSTPKPRRKCVECGGNISNGKRSDAIYCAESCRQRSKNERHKKVNPAATG